MTARSSTYGGWATLLEAVAVFFGPRAEARPAADEAAHQSAAIQVHLAEYAAITTRITYWIAIQYTAAGLLVGVAVPFLSAHLGTHSADNPPPTPLLSWLLALAIEFLLMGFIYVLFEIMSSSRYLEETLAPAVRQVVPQNLVYWGHERVKARIYSPVGMYIPALFCLATPLVTLFGLRPDPRSGIDWTFAIIGLLLAGAAVGMAAKAAREQRKILANTQQRRTRHP